MVKLRMMGTKNELKWMQRQLMRNSACEFNEFSEILPLRGTSKYHRMYVQVRKVRDKE